MDHDLKKLISFMVGTEEYSMELLSVKEIIRAPAVTRLPQMPSFVRGIIDLRADIMPVFDICDNFGVNQTAYTVATHVIVVDLEGRLVGMVVDSASQVVRIPADQITPPGPVAGGLPIELIEGVGKIGGRLIIPPNIGVMLSADEIIQLDRVEVVDHALERVPVSGA